MKHKRQIKVDPEVMDELLNEPEVKKHVEQMTPDELVLYKKLLVSQGIYTKYLKERERERWL